MRSEWATGRGAVVLGSVYGLASLGKLLIPSQVVSVLYSVLMGLAGALFLF